MSRLIIQESQSKLDYEGEVLVLADGLVLDTLTIHQPKELASKDLFIGEIRGNNCRIGEVIIMGDADDTDKESWKRSCISGLKITGSNNIIGETSTGYLHRPLLVTGENNQVGHLQADTYSGDPYNLCNHSNVIHKCSLSGALDIYPYDEYHLDKAGMMFLVNDKAGELIGCEVWNVTYTPTCHPLEATNAQGFLADGATRQCKIVNYDVPSTHIEHGITWADAVECEVINANTYGSAINWDRRSKGRLTPDQRTNICIVVS